jgi:predicted nucleotidyltransferase
MDRETAKVMLAYLKKVKRKYPDARAYLFGSRAKGDHWVTSNFDILVVSKRFGGKDIWERTGSLLKLWTYHRDLDVICLTPKELKRSKSTLLIASKNWILLTQ